MAGTCCDWVSICSDWLMPPLAQSLNVLTIMPVWVYMYSSPLPSLPSFHPHFPKSDVLSRGLRIQGDMCILTSAERVSNYLAKLG